MCDSYINSYDFDDADDDVNDSVDFHLEIIIIALIFHHYYDDERDDGSDTGDDADDDDNAMQSLKSQWGRRHNTSIS